MKALSIQQPWSWFIANGYKDIENRSWWTGYRGPVLIHAGKKFDKDGWEDICMMVPRIPEACERLKAAGNITPRQIMQTLGCIVGIAEIVDCVTESESPWFFGKYGFLIRNAKPLPLYSLKGQLGFFETGLALYDCSHCKTSFVWHCVPNYTLCKPCYDKLETRFDG